MRHEVVCFPEPKCAIVSATITVDEKLTRQLTVSEFGEFEGVTYPKAGRFETTGSGYFNELPFVYSFEVTSVRKITENDKANWWPEMPEGTYLLDLHKDADSKGEQFPFSPEVKRAFQKKSKLNFGLFK